MRFVSGRAFLRLIHSQAIVGKWLCKSAVGPRVAFLTLEVTVNLLKELCLMQGMFLLGKTLGLKFDGCVWKQVCPRMPQAPVLSSVGQTMRNPWAQLVVFPTRPMSTPTYGYLGHLTQKYFFVKRLCIPLLYFKVLRVHEIRHICVLTSIWGLKQSLVGTIAGMFFSP